MVGGILEEESAEPLVEETAPLAMESRPSADTTANGQWPRPSADGIEMFNLASVRITRYRYRGNTIPNPGLWPTTPNGRHPWRARCVEIRTAGSASGLGNEPVAIPTLRPAPTQPMAGQSGQQLPLVCGFRCIRILRFAPLAEGVNTLLVADWAAIVSSLVTRMAVFFCLVIVLLLSSCSSPTSAGHSDPAHTDNPLVTGEPAGYSADDVAFATNLVLNDQQGIDVSALVPDRSTNLEVVALAAKSTTALKSDVAVLNVLLVQWNGNPDIKTGGGAHGTTTRGTVDDATMAKLRSLKGTEFDTLWLQSMISLHQGAIEMANAEIANGKNVDAVGLAKQIIVAQQADVDQMKQILGG
jgi:uncharacterized protein (DUF305 family)